MNAPTEDIKDFLMSYDSSSSPVYEFGENLFISNEPDSPDTCITLIDTGGFDPEVSAVYEKPTIQIRSRSNPGSYEQAYNSLKTVVDLLHGNRFEINSTHYVLWQQGDIFNLGKDENNRPILTANMRIHRNPKTT